MDDASRPLAAHLWDHTPAVALSLVADRLAYRRKRWTARLVTAAVLAHQGALVVDVVHRALSDDPRTRASAAFGLFLLGVTSIGLGLLVVSLWRRSAAARPVVVPIDASIAEAVRIPELDAAPRDHLGLHGHVEPPQRW